MDAMEIEEHGGVFERFGAYRLLEVLGAGGMGVVHLAERDGREVALKRLPEWARGDDRLVRRFRREMAVHASLVHPNVVRVIACGNEPAPHIAMEPVHGRDLGKLMREPPHALPLRAALRVVGGVSRALAAVHARGLVHRDVTPENILLGSDGAVKLADFGVAYDPALDDPAERCATGKYAYAAPDPLLGAPPSPADDVYSLGVVLWEMLTGAPLVPRHDAVAAVDRVLHGTVPPPSLLALVPPEVDALVLSMLARQRSLRPTATQVAAQLTALARPTAPPTALRGITA